MRALFVLLSVILVGCAAGGKSSPLNEKQRIINDRAIVADVIFKDACFKHILTPLDRITFLNGLYRKPDKNVAKKVLQYLSIQNGTVWKEFFPALGYFHIAVDYKNNCHVLSYESNPKISTNYLSVLRELASDTDGKIEEFKQFSKYNVTGLSQQQSGDILKSKFLINLGGKSSAEVSVKVNNRYYDIVTPIAQYSVIIE